MRLSILKNNKGNSMIGAMLVMVVLAGAAATIVSLSGTDTKSYSNSRQQKQAEGVGNGGLQWALKKVSGGEDPNVTDKTYDPGRFTVVADPNSSLITVTAMVGEAKSVQSINANFAKDCATMALSSAIITDSTLTNIQFVKSCNESAILDNITVTWNESNCATSLNCDGTVEQTTTEDDDSSECESSDGDDDDHGDDDDDDSCQEVVYESVGSAGDGNFWICHVPPGNPSNAHSIAVSQSGWDNGHNGGSGRSHNMDYIGPCVTGTQPCTSTTDDECDDQESSHDEDSDGYADDDDDHDGYHDDDDDHDGYSDDDDDHDGCHDDDADHDGYHDDDADHDGEHDDEEEVDAQVYTCNATNASNAALASCASDTGGAKVEEVTLAGATVFKDGETPTVDSHSASSDEEIDLEDTAMTENGTYSMNVDFDEDIPDGTWVSIKAHFKDGSELYGTVKARTTVAPSTTSSSEDGTSASETDSSPYGFEVQGGTIVVDPYYRVDLQVLGSAITCGSGGSEISVRTKLCIDNTCSSLWSYGDVDGTETYSVTAGSIEQSYVVQANAYSSNCNNFSKTYDSTDTVQVRTLTNGETAPALAGYGGQQSVQQFLQGYLDSEGRVILNDNQVIMLFELGTNVAQDPSSSAADFQDLVMLMTITQVQ